MIAISTAFKKALIAVKLGEKEIFEELDANCKHSEKIMQTIDGLLDDLNVSISQNDVFALTIGPGSFTGLRIGLALIKGLCAGLNNSKVIPLTTFELMAYTYIKNNRPDENFTCVIDALSGLCFVCEFDKDGNKISEEKMIEIKELENIEGTKVSLVEENIENSVKIEPTAKDLLNLSLKNQERGEHTTVENLAPMYLRKSQAEASRDEAEKSQKKI